MVNHHVPYSHGNSVVIINYIPVYPCIPHFQTNMTNPVWHPCECTMFPLIPLNLRQWMELGAILATSNQSSARGSSRNERHSAWNRPSFCFALRWLRPTWPTGINWSESCWDAASWWENQHMYTNAGDISSVPFNQRPTEGSMSPEQWLEIRDVTGTELWTSNAILLKHHTLWHVWHDQTRASNLVGKEDTYFGRFWSFPGLSGVTGNAPCSCLETSASWGLSSTLRMGQTCKTASLEIHHRYRSSQWFLGHTWAHELPSPWLFQPSMAPSTASKPHTSRPRRLPEKSLKFLGNNGGFLKWGYPPNPFVDGIFHDFPL